MSPASKRLKIVCIASIFLGLFTLVAGIVRAQHSADGVTDYLTSICGIATIVLGTLSARLANVPAHARRIISLSAIIFVATLVACAVSLARANATPVNLVADILMLLCPLIILICAWQVKRTSELV